MILLSQVAMRRQMTAQEVKELDFPVIGWPVAPAIAIAFMVFILVMMGYFPDSRPALYVGVTWLVILCIAYKVWIEPKQKNQSGSSERDEKADDKVEVNN